MRKKVIVGNWKMNHTRNEAVSFLEGMKEEVKVAKSHGIVIGIAPTYMSLDVVSKKKPAGLILSAQNVNENANVNVCEDAGTQTLRTGMYNNVILTKDEFDEFKRQHPDDYSDRIERLSFYMYNNGKFYHDHFATLCRWAKEDIEKQNKESKEKQKAGKQDENLPPDAFPGIETLSFGEEET